MITKLLVEIETPDGQRLDRITRLRPEDVRRRTAIVLNDDLGKELGGFSTPIPVKIKVELAP
jgi:hypothetical protein